MTKEDIMLPVEMGRLEIEPAKQNVTINNQNPFIISKEKNKIFSQKLAQYSKCICASKNKDITIPIYKRRNGRVIKEPKLKLLQICNEGATLATFSRIRRRSVQSTSRSLPESGSFRVSHDHNISLRVNTLVDDCNQLRISSDNNLQGFVPPEAINHSKWWRNSDSSALQNKEAATSDKNMAGHSCSQEALNPPCDVTIDELASYFETLVHIPKKMSSMAEMMYI